MMVNLDDYLETLFLLSARHFDTEEEIKKVIEEVKDISISINYRYVDSYIEYFKSRLDNFYRKYLIIIDTCQEQLNLEIDWIEEEGIGYLRTSKSILVADLVEEIEIACSIITLMYFTLNSSNRKITEKMIALYCFYTGEVLQSDYVLSHIYEKYCKQHLGNYDRNRYKRMNGFHNSILSKRNRDFINYNGLSLSDLLLIKPIINKSEMAQYDKIVEEVRLLSELT